MSAKNKCIISFANKNGNYAQGLARLSDSLRNNFDGDFLAWMHEKSLRAPLHSENPYAFKVAAFDQAFAAGYDQVLWLDSSAYAVKSVQPLFDKITENGFFFHEAGHMLGEWSNDNLLRYFSLTRDAAMDLPMVMGGIMGLNSNPYMMDAFRRCSLLNIFKGKWNNDEFTESEDARCKGHRHEMSAMSAIVHEFGEWGKVSTGMIQYGGIYDTTLENTIIKFQGI